MDACSGSGDIDKAELLEHIKEPSSSFSDALFSLLDVDDDGTLSFSEFVNVCATFCMYSQEDILDCASLRRPPGLRHGRRRAAFLTPPFLPTVCFTIFDDDQSGWLDEDEFMKLCETVAAGSPMFPGNFKTALEQFDTCVTHTTPLPPPLPHIPCRRSGAATTTASLTLRSL